MPFGELSKWLSAIRDTELHSAIAEPYGICESALFSCVRQLVDVRNVYAHQGRLWDRDLSINEAMLSKTPPELVEQGGFKLAECLGQRA